MKKTAIILLVVVVVSLILAGILLAREDFDIQSVKKAVKTNPAYRAGQEVRYFKLLITDNRTKKHKVQMTLPVSLIEIFMKCTKNEELNVDCDDYQLDIKELLAELKRAGPMSIIEIVGEEATLKIWFE
jgi:hypothetical protein